MKFASNFIPYITFQFGFRLAVALVEPDASSLTNVGLAAFTDIDDASTDFYSASESPASFASAFTTLEDKLGLQAGTVKVDGRSGKPASLDLMHPVLPGDGVGNGLLWSVGGGHEGPNTDKEWSDLSIDAVKVSDVICKYLQCAHLVFNYRMPSCTLSANAPQLTAELDARSPNRFANRCLRTLSLSQLIW